MACPFPVGLAACMSVHHFTRIIALILVPFLVVPDAAFARKPLSPEKAKEKITQRGVGHSVRLVLTDKTTVKGMLAKIGPEECEINVEGTRQIQPVSYSQVAEYHNGKLSTAAKVGIGIAVGIGIFIGGATAALAGRDD
jgi:hypothetical protein